MRRDGGPRRCAIIGAGISGIAASIRMRNKGFAVTVFEANDFPGGKLSSETVSGYRFDMGPSVFTFPEYVDELFTLSKRNPRDHFNYDKLDPVYRYFFEDGSVLQSRHDKVPFAEEMARTTKDDRATILRYLDNSQRVYELTAPVFLHSSLHKAESLFTKQVLKNLLNVHKIGAFETMNQANEKAFRDPRLVQIANRYATYNGSSPYLSPSTLNVIPYVEVVRGAYYPVGGMISITSSLVTLAKELGVELRLSTPVREILLSGKRARGVRTDASTEEFDVVISNMDVYNTYKKLLPGVEGPKKVLSQPKSSSGIIFYWGIRKAFDALGLHNILFSADYEREFDAIFSKKTLFDDPTVYVNITSKHTPTDAPPGCENWFAFINVPHDAGQDWDALVARARKNVIGKVNRLLETDLEPLIEAELVFDPRVIEKRTSSAFGAIYGNASNDKFSAFLRHANFSRDIENLYFTGGSVHPGPSIPLCLLSAKITTGLIS